MPRCLIALGANLGDRQQSLERALALLDAMPQVRVVAHSRWHETAPVGGAPGQGPFLNGAATIDTALDPQAFHQALAAIETAAGRTRSERWDARLLDLDLLLYDEQTFATPSLVVPHPRMAFRRFVLEPAAEVAPQMVHPPTGWTVAQLLTHLRTALPYVALLGSPKSGKTSLARALCQRFSARLLADSPVPPPSLSPPNPPSRAYERQIQFLDRRRQLTDRQSWSPENSLAISDFYFDQTLVYARAELEGDGLAAFERAYEAARATVVAPKLTVALATQGELPLDGLGRALLELAERRGIGPVLYAGSGNEQSQLDEISAAILAMQ